MGPTPWTALAPAAPGRDYLVLVTVLPLRAPALWARFVVLADAIEDQLAGSPGCLGYAWRAERGPGRFLTLSAWEDAAALHDFVVRAAHQEAMAELAEHLGRSRFTRFRIAGADLPPDFGALLKRVGEV